MSIHKLSILMTHLKLIKLIVNDNLVKVIILYLPNELE